MKVLTMRNDCSPIEPLRVSGVEPALFSFYAFAQDTIIGVQVDRPIYEFHPLELDEARDFLSVQELAAVYLNYIFKIQQRGPYLLCGYSFGGLVAYEIATLLEKEGKEIGLLALFDTSHPQFSRNISVIELARFRVTYLTNRFLKYGKNLMYGKLSNIKADVLQFIIPRLRTIAWRVTRAAFRTANRPVPRIMRRETQAVATAWRTYTPGTCTNRLVLFRVEDRGVEYNRDMTLGWRACVTSDIEVHVVPGRHEDMMKKPYVHVLVEKLNSYLAGIGNRHSP